MKSFQLPAVAPRSAGFSSSGKVRDAASGVQRMVDDSPRMQAQHRRIDALLQSSPQPPVRQLAGRGRSIDVIQAKRVIGVDQVVRDEPDGYQLQTGEQFEPEDSSSSEADVRDSVGEIGSSPLTSHDGTGHQQVPSANDQPAVPQAVAMSAAAQMESLSDSLEAVGPAIAVSIEIRNDDEAQSHEFPTAEHSSRNRGERDHEEIDVEAGRQRVPQERAEQRSRVVACAEGGSAVLGTVLDILAMTAAAVGVYKEPTGVGVAYFMGVAALIGLACKATLDDIVSCEADPRDWPGRIGYGALMSLVPLLSIPMGLPGTQYGQSVNREACVWLPYALGVLVALAILVFRLGGAFDRKKSDRKRE